MQFFPIKDKNYTPKKLHRIIFSLSFESFLPSVFDLVFGLTYVPNNVLKIVILPFPQVIQNWIRKSSHLLSLQWLKIQKQICVINL